MLEKKRWLLIVMSIATIAMLAGCSDDPASPGVGGLTSEQQFQAVHDAAITYINGPAPATVSADALNLDRDNYTVIDIRTQTDFDNGHIGGAIHTSLGTLIVDINAGTIPTGKPIVVACYTGQTAGHATLALRMLGYEAHILLWGMSSWNTTLASKWNDAVGDNLPVNLIEADPNALTTEVPWPTMSTGASTADEAVDARVAAMLAGGFKAISVSTLVADGPANYFILNYFGPADYVPGGGSGVPGHIEGAFQFTPYESLAMDEQLKYLPTDKQILVYCWTGQHASQVVGYLTMLGYDAYDLAFSSNALWYTSLTAHKWSEAVQSRNYPLVATS